MLACLQFKEVKRLVAGATLVHPKIGESENPFSGMNSTWDRYTIGINQIRIVDKNDVHLTFAAVVLFKIYCHVIHATFEGQNLMLQGKSL